MKRITFEVDETFAKKFSHYCEENNITKKSAIMNLLSKELDKKGMMKQYATINQNENRVDFINEENYRRLSRLTMENTAPWRMKKNLHVNKKINYYFEFDETLDSLLFFSDISEIEDLSIPFELLDHYHCVKFNNKDMDYYFRHLYGVMTFPYIDFKMLSEIIYSWNTVFWNIYIINPALMKYASGSIGLFITPLDFDDTIAEYNGLFETLTGYKLFYSWTCEKKIMPIMQNKKSEDISKWCESLKDDDFPKMYQKIVKFWFNNRKIIKCRSLEDSYFQFTHKMNHDTPSLMMLSLGGPDFEMFDTKTGWTTGKCNDIQFDLKTFNCIYVDGKEIVFTSEMFKNFKDGTFELRMK